MASLGKWDSTLNNADKTNGVATQSNNTQPSLGGFGNLLTTLGLGAIKNIGADAVDIGKGIYGAATGTNQFANGYNNPLRSEQELSQTRNPQNLAGAGIQEGKDLAGLASWVVPESKVFKGGNLLTKVLAGAGNATLQGGAQGALSALSQDQVNPQSVVAGAVGGAATNTAMSGAGRFLTDTLPRYIGIRNYGAAGAKLPEVVQAENEAAKAGGDTLKDARMNILNEIKPFELNPTQTGGQTDRYALLSKVQDLANKPEWIGTPGLSDLVKKSTKVLPAQSGELPNIESAIQNSPDMFTAYSRIKNMAYPADNTPVANRISSFLHSAAQTVRDHLINTSSNPDATRKAMDMYAAQTAMQKAKGGIGGNKVTNMIANLSTGGGGEGGLAALTAMIPMLHGLSIPLAVDTALTNRVSGPPLARGLINLGNSKKGQATGNLLKRLGIGAGQAISNSNISQSQ